MYKTVTFVPVNIYKTVKRRDCVLYHIHLNIKKSVMVIRYIIRQSKMISRYGGKCMLAYILPISPFSVFSFNTTQLEQITSYQITSISPLLSLLTE